MTEPLARPELIEWLRRTVDDAYHGSSTNTHHSFEECGDPFCSDAKTYLAQVEDLLAGVPLGDGGRGIDVTKITNDAFEAGRQWERDHIGDEGCKATVEDRLTALLADLRKTNDHGQNPQLGEAADHVEAALELVRVWALGIVL